MIDRQKAAFTLAEVLITLGIVGVVAAMTIPTLINNYQKHVILTQVKKNYSIFSQALKLAEVDNGPTDSWNWGSTSVALTTTFADTYFYPYIKVSKKCDNGSTECWNNPVSISNVPSEIMNSYALSAVLSSGASVFFWAGGGATPHVQFWIDIDGPNKGRNMMGNDLFEYILFLKPTATYKQGFFPVGLEYITPLTRDQIKDDATYGCNKSVSTSMAGRNCTGLIVIDGWKLSSDYPY